MQWNWKNFVATVVSAAVFACVALGQDFNTFKGDNNRTGKNGDPVTYNPGRANLRWYHPLPSEGKGGSVFIDNLDAVNAVFTGGWVDAPGTNLASGFYFPNNATAGQSPYKQVNTIASAADPTVKLNAGDSLETATFTLQPGDGIPRGYALYVDIPTGPTNGVFPQRYFVVQVISGSGQSDVQIVDSHLGGGFVRLGNGGKTTDKLYAYDGTNPFTIKVYNTVPRDNVGNLTDIPGTTLVYGDAAAAVSQYGDIVSSASVYQWTAGGTFQRAVLGVNRVDLAVINGNVSTVQSGLARSLDLSTGIMQWEYRPSGGSEGAILDDVNVGVTADPSFTSSTAAASFYGTDYLTNAITNIAGSAVHVSYAPTLNDGDYNVYVWLPGDSNGQAFGHAITYEIHEGATVTTFTVDQSTNKGWLQLGNRKFTHSNALGNPLQVWITNYSADPTDATRQCYADAVWFVGNNTSTIRSSPIQATVNLNLIPGGPPAATAVTVIASEDGHLYCLDAKGNGDGTTNVYWVYPSKPDVTNPLWTDPNQVVGLDGPGGIAQMPTGFDTSSALIQNIGGTDFLYIASTNGRIYCIDMTGRGDMDIPNGKPGTTTRVWSYPDDYPSTPVPSNLGPFKGSIAAATTGGGQQLIIVPAPQGRVYALDATGNAVTKKTTVLWQYPAPNAPVLGPIQSTPAVEFGSVFVGTTMLDSQNPGQFLALNVDTGALQWTFTGTGGINADNFLGGPTTAAAALLGAGMPDTVFVANDNRHVYALQASSGAVLWDTAELSSTVHAPLTFSYATVYDNTGLFTLTTPVVYVPTEAGTFGGLFAQTTTLNIAGGRLAWGYQAAGPIEAGLASGRSWMIGGDRLGNTYAFNDLSGFLGGYPGGGAPGIGVGVPNDPDSIAFNNAKIKLIKKATYDRLAGGVSKDYAEATSASNEDSSTNFEWGQTAYALFYDFPYDPNALGAGVVVDFSLSVEGSVFRNTKAAFQFDPLTVTTVTNGKTNDGFVVFPIAIRGIGQNSLAPGSAEVKFNVIYNGKAFFQTANRTFGIANPLALVMQVDNLGNPIDNQQIGYTTDLTKPETLVNGSPSGVGTGDKSRLTSTVGEISHGQNGLTTVGVTDRSLMTLQYGNGQGLDNVRVQRQDLVWMNGATVMKPLPAYFSGFEDGPGNFPNNSLDYPDVHRERIKITKSFNGSPQNPVVTPVPLIAPVLNDPLNYANRTLAQTPFEFEVDVPRFQPPNGFASWLDSAGNTVTSSNYVGKMVVYVDSEQGNGTFDPLENRTAFRSFNLALGVPPDENFYVATPTVDLGDLNTGTGYTTAVPDTASSTYTPTSFANIFKSFKVLNQGNVNLVNMRVARGTIQDTNFFAWPLYPLINNSLAWLDGSKDMWSDIGAANQPTSFAPTPQVILEKARVGDTAPTRMATNPKSRFNPNLPNSGQLANPLLAAMGDPRISVTLPLGFPSGPYSQLIRVIEDTSLDEDLNYTTGVPQESFSDPTFTLKFNVVESMLTNSHSVNTAAMIDEIYAPGVSAQFPYINIQPTGSRDLLGNLWVAFASDRGTFVPATVRAEVPSSVPLRLFLTRVKGGMPVASQESPLDDLHNFVPDTATRWFSQQLGPFPDLVATPPDTLFNSQPGETVIPATLSFSHPAMPSWGWVNPFSPSTAFTKMAIGFIGNAQKGTATGRNTESRIFATVMSVDGSSNATLSNPVSMNSETLLGKDNVSVLQVGTNGESTFFYSAKDGLRYVTFDGAAFGTPAAIQLPSAFQSATNPNVTARLYAGSNGAISPNIIELVFSGKLQGRTASEIYMARLNSNASGVPTGLAYLPSRTQEPLEYDAVRNVFHAKGLAWNPAFNTKLYIVRNNALIDVEVGARTVDPNTGAISFPSAVGGIVTLDPQAGTVRFSTQRPSTDSILVLNYQPKVATVSVGTSSFTQPVIGYDDRLVGDNPGAAQLSYWARSDGTGALPADQIKIGRYWVTYGRAAAGAGQGAQPFMKTMRLGVQLPTPMYTTAGGNIPPASLTVTGVNSFFQIDPALGRIYFTEADEDNPNIRVAYTGIDQSNGQPLVFAAAPYSVSLLAERDQSPLPLEHSVNEQSLWFFMDPFDPAAFADRRPGLVWMFWNSTRSGGSDLFFQTLAPNFVPAVSGK